MDKLEPVAHGAAAPAEAVDVPKPSTRPDTMPADILPGHGGWLFFMGHPGILARMYSFRPKNLWALFRWRALILRRIARASRIGVRYVQFFVPDKVSIYRDQLDAPFPDAGMSPARRIGMSMSRAVLRSNWIDSYGEFRRARQEGELYYRTDTHWSALGYLVGYRLLCEAAGVAPAPHVLGSALQRRPLLMDIASKCSPPVHEMEEMHVFARFARRVDENELTTFRERYPVHIVGTSFGSRIVLRNDEPNVDPRTVMVFGDSHLFYPHGLGAMLAETFREVHMLWSSPIDWAYVERVKPDILVHELAERFIRRRPVDGIDLDAFAAARLDEAKRAAEPVTVAIQP